MQRAVFAVLLILLSGPVSLGQEIIDNTVKFVTPAIQEQLFSALRRELADGYSAKLTVVIPRTKYLCGFVNAKNRLGAYTGNTPFKFEYADKSLTILPPPGDAVHDFYRVILLQRGCAVEP